MPDDFTREWESLWSIERVKKEIYRVIRTWKLFYLLLVFVQGFVHCYLSTALEPLIFLFTSSASWQGLTPRKKKKEKEKEALQTDTFFEDGLKSDIYTSHFLWRGFFFLWKGSKWSILIGTWTHQRRLSGDKTSTCWVNNTLRVYLKKYNVGFQNVYSKSNKRTATTAITTRNEF